MQPAAEEEFFDSILAGLLAEVDAGGAPTKEDLLARHPGHEETVARVWRAFERYRALRVEPPSPHGPSIALAPGERLGEFVVLAPLARGGMGTVYRAEQPALGDRVVALKVMPSESCSESARARFRREALSLARVHHRHLVEIYGFGEERDLLFYAMRLVEGPTLQDVLERLAADASGSFDVRARRRIVRRIGEVASALDALHRAGLVHRDVKPANVVLEGHGTDGEVIPDRSAVLVDFGLVRAVESRSLTLTGHSPATPSYAPPEQLLGGAIDARADVFSLGVTLHDLLARRRPHERMQASAGLEELHALDASIDRDLSAVVAKAVDPDARYRYSNAGAFLADLRAWLDGQEVAARRPSAVERFTRWARRHPGTFVRRAGIAFVALAIASLALVGSSTIAAQRRQVHAAWSSGNTVALFGALRHVRPWLRWLVVPDEVDARWIERAHTWSTRDPMVTVHDLHGVRREDDAPFGAATYLRVKGLCSDELLLRYLEERLANIAAASEPATRDRAHRLARIVARLFYERPVATIEDEIAVARIREVLMRLLLREHESDDETWLYVLSALAGCGRPEDIAAIVDAALRGGTVAGPHAREADRLGLRVAEGLIRRAHTMGQLDRVDHAAVWSSIEPWILCCTRDEGQLPWPMHIAVDGVLEAAVFAACDAQVSVPSMRDGSWRMRDQCEVPPDVGKSRALARLGDLELWNDLVRRNGTDERWSAKFAGALTGAFSDAQLTDTLYWYWACRDDPADREEFADAHLATVLRRLGLTPEFDLDPTTLLQFERDVPAPERVVPSRRVAWDEGAFPRFVSTFDLLGWSEHLPTVRRQWLEPQSFWRFRRGGSLQTHGGTAHSAVLRSGALASAGDYLVLGTPGESEVRLRFDLAEVPAGSWWELALRQQLGARDFYPYQGQVDVEIRLNGALVVSSWTVFQKEAHEQHIDLPSNRLEPGVNEVSIRLARTTTTTYRLHFAMIRQRKVD